MYKLTIFGVSLAELQHIDHKVYYIQHGSKDYRIKPYLNYHVIYFNFKLNFAFLSHKEVILKQLYAWEGYIYFFSKIVTV